MTNPEDDADLPPPPSSEDLRQAEELVEVYRTDNEMAANVVIDELLAPAGIDAFRHDRRSHALPIPSSFPGQMGIAVDRSLADRARDVLREAKSDGVLMDDDGQIIDGEAGGAVV
ncbi:MAG: hypothetical protein EXR72_05840 [Myxococcales bacterium]|nr:hypothetical protein [Myxococcales bacterium]